VSPTLIAGGIALGAFALVGLQTWRLGNAHEELGAVQAVLEVQKEETQQAVDVNVKNNTEIDQLVVRIAEMLEVRRLETIERDRVLAVRDEDLAAARSLARRLEGERDAIFRDDMDCAAMGGIRIDAACPLIAHQLRERTGRSRSEGSADGGGPG
jgi:hypothetical protein